MARVAVALFAAWLVVLVGTEPARAAIRLAPVPGVDAPASPMLDRVVVIGASVSNGFGHGVALAPVFDHALKAKHEPVFDGSSAAMFIDPLGVGQGLIDQCLDRNATLVIGVDFLFWYAFAVPGHDKDESERRNASLDLGLAQLDRLACPLVVGDLPDMRDAKSTRLPAALMPTIDILEQMNEKIRAWAEKKPNVDVMPLNEWLKGVKAGSWSVEKSPDGHPGATPLPSERAIQPDLIHPTAFGTLVLAERLIDRIRVRHHLDAAAFDLDIWPSAFALIAARDDAAALTIGRAIARGTKTVVLVRHAEKAAAADSADPRDPALSQAGNARAAILAGVLSRSGASVLLASEFRRTRETLAPLATAIGVTVDSIPANDLDALIQRIESAPANATIVVAAHSNTLPAIARRLGVTIGNVVTVDGQPSLRDDEFGRLFVISIPDREAPIAPELIELRYGA